MPPGFIHLHLHSEYSLIDSTIRIPDLVRACAQADMPAVAMTDQANMFALVKFYKAAEAAGIKPIAGADLWIADPADRARPQRLTVLCQDRAGYLNLSRLLTRAYGENRHGDHALVEADWFTEAGAGLIALAGQHSDIGRLLLAGRDEAARARAQWWRARFPERLYLEVVRSERPQEEAFLAQALAVAAALDLPAVATNDVRFLARDDFAAHEARVCIHAGRVLADPRRPRDHSPEQYLKSPAEMAALFADLPELLDNAVELGRRCNLELSFGTYHLPAFPVPSGDTLDHFIRSQAEAGLDRHLAVHPLAAGFTREDYAARLAREVDVIVQMGFPGYFLIVADFINWAKQNDIPVGPGRGSGAGSLVAWALGITDLDPLRYGLLFERFLNPERVSMPDFDIDFCMDRRDEVIDYVGRKYGRDRVSQIITYGTMAAKAVLRDAGRVLSMPYGQVDRIAKLLPRVPLDLTLEDALGRSEKSRKESDRVVADFKAEYESDAEVQELVDLALKLEDLTRNAGKHAGGVVIAPAPLSEFAPLFSEHGAEGMVTQFDKDDVEAVGLVKFDFLGLRTLTIIDWAVKAINRRKPEIGNGGSGIVQDAARLGDNARGALGDSRFPIPDSRETALDITQIPLDDPAVFKLLQEARTVAVFQLESRGMQGLLKEARPDCFEDIIALVSLYRPGPMDLIPSYCARKHGREAIEYADPRVEPVLQETYGIMVYQEQVMQMAQVVGGYTLGGADLLRRAMGKKKVEEMVKHRAIFREGAAAHGLDEAKADSIFDLMEKFAGYGFNKSHAAAYALVSYQTAWLKAHYPAEFMAAVLSSDMDNTDKVVNFLAEARALGLSVRPPDINASAFMFEAIDEQTLQYGLGAVKGVGRGAVEAIVEARRQGGPFRDLLDLYLRVDSQKLNKRLFEALIQSGSLDALAANRATLAVHLPEAARAADQALRDRQSGQVDIFGASTAAPTLVQLPEPVAEWPIETRLSGERATLGHYLSGHPTDACRDLIAGLTSCAIGEIERHYRAPAKADPGDRRSRYTDLQPFTLAGQVVAIRKQGDSRAFVTVEDHSGRFEAVLYRETWADYGELLTRDAILVFEGGLSIDDFSGGYQLRVQSVTTLDTACEKRVRALRLRLDGVEAGFADSLRAALHEWRGGSTPVRVRLAGAGVRADLELGADWRVRANPGLAERLRTLEGVLSAELVFD